MERSERGPRYLFLEEGPPDGELTRKEEEDELGW